MAEMTIFADKTSKNDVVSARNVTTKTAEECVELQCSCCINADQIRLEHPIIPEEDLTEEEKERRKKTEHEEEMEKLEQKDRFDAWWQGLLTGMST